MRRVLALAAVLACTSQQSTAFEITITPASPLSAAPSGRVERASAREVEGYPVSATQPPRPGYGLPKAAIHGPVPVPTANPVRTEGCMIQQR